MVQVADRRIEPDEHEIPPVGPGEALLRVEACGLCGSDVEQFRGTMAAAGIMRYPVIPGHEPIGRIVELGAGVTGARDHVDGQLKKPSTSGSLLKSLLPTHQRR